MPGRRQPLQMILIGKAAIAALDWGRNRGGATARSRMGTASDGVAHADRVDRALDALAAKLADHVDTARLLAIAGEAR